MSTDDGSYIRTYYQVPAEAGGHKEGAIEMPSEYEYIHLTEDEDWEAIAARFGGRLVNVEQGQSGEYETELRIGDIVLREGDAIAVRTGPSYEWGTLYDAGASPEIGRAS